MGLRRPLETLFRARRRQCLWLQSSSLPGHVAELTHKLARVVWNHQTGMSQRLSEPGWELCLRRQIQGLEVDLDLIPRVKCASLVKTLQ